MGFWAKRIFLICLVIAGAIAAILYMPQAEKLDENGNPIPKRSIEENMAAFYEEFSLVSKSKIEEEYGEFVIPLEMSEQPIAQQLGALNKPLALLREDFNWRGEYKTRPFAQNSTLMGNANAYVSEAGMELIWHLNQDFIVRHRFLSENNIAGMLQELASAIDANFTRSVDVYYCARQRVMVITDQDDDVLKSNCQQLD
uniref:TcpQ domain-containing protein n=1 Tax=Ningiella ruwaisensis TaxID=2364274 RepID=UPI00109F3AEC|nr:TcpQ domain-containing protein [Ningiella ruwaisensis]